MNNSYKVHFDLWSFNTDVKQKHTNLDKMHIVTDLKWLSSIWQFSKLCIWKDFSLLNLFATRESNSVQNCAFFREGCQGHHP